MVMNVTFLGGIAANAIAAVRELLRVYPRPDGSLEEPARRLLNSAVPLVRRGRGRRVVEDLIEPSLDNG